MGPRIREDTGIHPHSFGKLRAGSNGPPSRGYGSKGEGMGPRIREDTGIHPHPFDRLRASSNLPASGYMVKRRRDGSPHPRGQWERWSGIRATSSGMYYLKRVRKRGYSEDLQGWVPASARTHGNSTPFLRLRSGAGSNGRFPHVGRDKIRFFFFEEEK